MLSEIPPPNSNRIPDGTNAPTVEELIAEIKIEYQKLGPFLDLEVLPEPQRSRTEGGLTMGGRAVESGRRPGA
jgi:hypothetical protein